MVFDIKYLSLLQADKNVIKKENISVKRYRRSRIRENKLCIVFQLTQILCADIPLKITSSFISSLNM